MLGQRKKSGILGQIESCRYHILIKDGGSHQKRWRSRWDLSSEKESTVRRFQGMMVLGRGTREQCGYISSKGWDIIRSESYRWAGQAQPLWRVWFCPNSHGILLEKSVLVQQGDFCSNGGKGSPGSKPLCAVFPVSSLYHRLAFPPVLYFVK